MALNVLELYSGIGGMHYALKGTSFDTEVVAAMEINTVANTVYQYNFEFTRLLQKNILSLNARAIDALEIDMIVMSPPCQPFTRTGNKRDIADTRSDSLSHLINILPSVGNRLKFILLENVRGFETSKARKSIIEALGQSFSFVEYILNPLKFGIPNSRERYYLLGRRKPLTFDMKLYLMIKENICPESEVLSIKDILEFNDDSPLYNEYLVPEETLVKRLMVMDIISKTSKQSCCFTKAYGRYAEGTGSVYCPHDDSSRKDKLEEIQNCCDKDKLQLIQSLRLRFFTSKEIARLMCFPETFEFPKDTTLRQKYKLLGNSLNIKVVSNLINVLLTSEQ